VSIDEIVHTCSNEKVAQAAVASLGFDFARRVRIEAESHGTTTGALVARLVHEFRETSGMDDCRAIKLAMVKADQPLLSGLRVLLETRLESIRGASFPQWSLCSLPGALPSLEVGQLG